NGFHPRATILIDADDPAAAWWKKTRELADQDAAGEPGARDQLSDRDTQLRANPFAVLPRARNSILLVSDGVADAVSSVPAAPRDAIGRYELKFQAWRDAVRAQVSPESIRGLLDDAPSRVLERLDRERGIRVARRALRVGRTPSDF